MTIALGETEIDAVNVVTISASSVRDKVGRLDITMDEMARVHELHAFQHLIGDHQDGFQREPPSALIELILQRRSQEVHDHQVVRVLCTEIVDLGKAWCILELPVDLVFMAKLRAASSVLFEFDSDLIGISSRLVATVAMVAEVVFSKKREQQSVS